MENIEIWFQIEKDAEGFPKSRDWEGLACEPRGPNYEVKSIPFYLKNVAYGDVILANRSPEGFLKFESIVSRGGYSVYRIWLSEGTEDPVKVVDELCDLGLLVERDGRLISVAVPPDVDAHTVAEFVVKGKDSGRWSSQDGFIFEPSDQENHRN